MNEQAKTNPELIEEISILMQKIKELEHSEAESKRVEEALRESEERYRNLFENANEAMFVAQDGKLVFLNPRTAMITGYSAEELLSSPFIGFIHLDDREMVIDRHVRRMNGEELPHHYHFRIIHRDGNIRWVELNAVLINWNGKAATLNFMSDITERRRADEALRASEERYRNLFDNHAAVKLLIDPDTGRIIDANEAAVHYYGWSYEQLKQMKIQEINTLSPEDVKKEMEQARTNKRVYFEFRHRRADGSIRDVEVFSSKIEDKGKALLHSIIHDITNRKQAEESLRDSEDRYTMIMNNITDRIWLTDMNFKIIWASESVMRDRGYQLEEINPFSFEKLLTPDSLETVSKTISNELTPQRLQQKNLDVSKTLELEFSRKDGSTFWSEVKMMVLRDHDGSPSSILGVGRDITDRKRAEQALRVSEQKYRHLFEKAEEGILITRGETIEFANPALARILGQPLDRIIAHPFVPFIHPEDREMVFDRNRRRTRGETVETGYDFRILTSDGDVRWLRITSRVIEWDDIPASLSFLADITDRKQAEEEKRRLEERLHHAEKMESIGTLAGGIAHDFNNLLMGIQGYASLTLLDLDPSHPHYERIKRIEEQVQSGADLTRQLLGFARGGRYEVKPADMNDIIKKTSSMFGRTKKEITIHRKYGKDLWSVEVDQGQMEQVFMNLYVNAWQAMPGGGEIYLEMENVLLDDEQAFSYTVQPGKYVKITVTDTGTGMDEKTRERIFDPFFTTKEMGRGTGLGLATVYGIIKGHKGMINVYSEPGHGTTFSIYLPASEKEVVKEKTAAGTIARGTETILLVDDEKMVVEVTRELLESLGYRVYVAGSGQEAIAVYMGKRKEIALVILDMIMPGISGGETFDRLREINPDIRVLLSSGYSINGEAQSILNRGCNGFLQKPFQLEKLSRSVREVLD
jgi:two-component system cell cycle sensor histidine kinase/response regulator CckA